MFIWNPNFTGCAVFYLTTLFQDSFIVSKIEDWTLSSFYLSRKSIAIYCIINLTSEIIYCINSFRKINPFLLTYIFLFKITSKKIGRKVPLFYIFTNILMSSLLEDSWVFMAVSASNQMCYHKDMCQLEISTGHLGENESGKRQMTS